MTNTQYTLTNISTGQSILVDKKFFDSSKFITEVLHGETECPLPVEYYDENVISFLNNLFLKLELDYSNLLMLTKALVLMDFLNIELHGDFLMEKVSEILYKDDIDNLESNIDEKFAINYRLVTLLWNKTKNKKIFFKLTKLNYVNLELDLTVSHYVTQEDFDNIHENLKNGIIKINASERSEITNVNMFTELEELDVSGSGSKYCSFSVRCGIDQNGIQQLTKLRKFNTEDNYKITDVNHLTQLEELNAAYYSGIDQNGIQQLTNLRILNAWSNDKITDVNHLIQLEALNASHNCGIDQNGIRQLRNLRILDVSRNGKIKDINHLTHLEALYAGDSEIDQNSIQQLFNLRILNADRNVNITNVNHLTKLEELHAVYCSGIDQNAIQQLTNLRVLRACFNDKITDVNHLTQLEELDASWNCGIDQNGIQQLTKLQFLNADDNNKIKDINHLTQLRTLYARSNCGIDQNGIQQLTNLRILDAYRNKKITIKID
jgi:hypothetical protein